ncbi:poly polymerase catalytic domain-containing protein [Polychytrium aggregatum]|uniref:poly polymerase catalytic domain-containing protein n=1 Tax=Polychytrium aggregatum TaxID=110093 RepID=UPI0022FE0397|nr:poly polymerase catalytic domain-containing protein [Polychytrium aggregatum]KAI9208208.1 poly polymerase catalytic domain-containing protein [Polychytrium aggregatum]
MSSRQEGDILAEYAKSNRSGCKQCFATIAKDDLRMGVLKQAQGWDGLQPAWFHLKCFFKRKEGKELAEAESVHGLTKLKWDDQERIRDSIGSKAAVSASQDANDANDTKDTNDTKDEPAADGTAEPKEGFVSEYAKTGRSKCRGCDGKIEAKEMRLALPVETDNGKFKQTVPGWHHPKCFFEKNPGTVSSITDFMGYAALSEADQKLLKSMIGGADSTPSTDAKPDDKPDDKSDAAAAPSAATGAVKPKPAAKRAPKRAASPKHRSGWSNSDQSDASGDEYGKRKKAPKRKHKVTKRSDDEGEAAPTAAPVTTKSESDNATNATTETPSQPTDQKAQLREQSKAMWAMRENITRAVDGLKAADRKNLYYRLLVHNDINVDAGAKEDVMLDFLIDAMTFGVAQKCPECQVTRLVPSEEVYRCIHRTEWGRCAYTTNSPHFLAFKSPKGIEIDWFKKFQFKAHPRILITRAARPVASEVSASASASASLESKSSEPTEQEKPFVVVDSETPFKGKTICFAGKLSKTQAEYQKSITIAGGSAAKALDDTVNLVVANKAEVSKASGKVVEALRLNIDVVDESYVTDCIEQKKILDWRDSKYLLQDGRPKKIAKRELEEKPSEEREVKRAKFTLKGGAVVDPDSGLDKSHHVHQHAGTLWSVILAKTDVQTNQNSFYKLQILVCDKTASASLFRSWGRVGTSIGGNKCESMSLQSACTEFRRLYLDKTGNEFGTHNFQKLPRMMYPLEVDYGETEKAAESKISAGSKTKLARPVVDLMKILFDIKQMRQTLLELEIDLNKMPLGKMTKKQIKEAYSVLSEALALFNEEKSTGRAVTQTKWIQLSNKFFTLIPHDFGTKSPPLLNTDEIIQSKLELLNTLLEIEIATTIIGDRQDSDEFEDPVDINYRKLHTDMEVLPHDSEEFKLIDEYTSSTHAATHSSYGLTIESAFRVKREGELERYESFKDLHNKKLLWHGSRLTNFVGILSQGLRIAPPEAPATGYMFGKGVYFADMVSKSANYCFTSPGNNTGVLLLCEVALGDMYERDYATYVTTLPNGLHSTKGCGRTIPSKEVPHPADPDLMVPLGPAKTTTKSGALLYNEYIVYDVSQIKIKYLLRVRFNYKR